MNKKIPNRITRAQLVAMSREMFGDKFSYQRITSNWLTPSTPIILTCATHGDFTTTVSEHLMAPVHGGCSKCYATAKKTTQKRKTSARTSRINNDLDKLAAEGIGTYVA